MNAKNMIKEQILSLIEENTLDYEDRKHSFGKLKHKNGTRYVG